MTNIRHELISLQYRYGIKRFVVTNARQSAVRPPKNIIEARKQESAAVSEGEGQL